MMRIESIKGGVASEELLKKVGRDSYLFNGAWWGWHLCYFCKAVATLQRKLDRTRLVGRLSLAFLRARLDTNQ